MARRTETGQAVAELAMVLPVLLLILLGCLDLGRAFYVWMALANGSREGARYACLYPTDANGALNTNAIILQAQADILAEGLSTDALEVTVSAPSGTANGSPIIVTALYRLPAATSYLFGGRPLTIKAATEMLIIGGS